MAKKSGLGKGLDALFLDNETAESSSLMNLRISDIEPNKEQPRKAFEQGALEELANSIREHGILQPVVVRAMPAGVYQIIAGERRWRASRMAGLAGEIPSGGGKLPAAFESARRCKKAAGRGQTERRSRTAAGKSAGE